MSIRCFFRMPFLFCISFFSICIIYNWSFASAAVESWYLPDDVIHGYRPMVIMENKIIADKINSDINDYIYSESTYFSKLSLDKSIGFDYIVTYEDDGVVSFLLKEQVYDGHYLRLTQWKGITYNKNTGERCKIGYFIKLKDADISNIAIQNWYSVNGSTIQHNRNNITYTKISPLFKVDRVFDNFYLIGGGGIAIIYPKDYLGSDNAAFPVIKMDVGQVKYYNWENSN
jgi:hypothetical protein